MVWTTATNVEKGAPIHRITCIFVFLLSTRGVESQLLKQVTKRDYCALHSHYLTSIKSPAHHHTTRAYFSTISTHFSGMLRNGL